MNKVSPASVALATAALSAMAQQAHAGVHVNIDSNLVDDSLSETIRKTFANDHIKKVSGDYAPLLGKNLTLDGKPAEIDVSKLVAVYQAKVGDSADANGDRSIEGVCYGNCHSACHGSRGWR